MRVTVLSWFDQAGGAGRLAQAINETGEHQARALTWSIRPWHWPTEHKPTREHTIESIQWADALIVVGVRYPVVGGRIDRDVMFPPGAPQRPTVVNYRGSNYYQHVEYHNRMDKEDGVIASGNFCDLLATGGLDHWLPNPIWSKEIAGYRDRQPDDVFRVVQAVIHPERLIVKQSPQVRAALTDLEGIEYEAITGLAYHDALARIGQRADVVATSFEVGFGNAGLEGMCMGIPVIGWGPPAYLREISRQVGYFPFIVCDLDGLRHVVDTLRYGAHFYDLYTHLGPRYVQEFHAPNVVAQKAIELCKLAGG